MNEPASMTLKFIKALQTFFCAILSKKFVIYGGARGQFISTAQLELDFQFSFYQIFHFFFAF